MKMKRFMALLLVMALAFAVVTPVFASPSRWAEEDVDDAIELGLVPVRLQSNFQNTTTRAEFAALAVALYENQRGPIGGRVFFDDTNNIDVEKAAYIGIVSGVGGNRFNPYGNLTREQAAVLVARVMEAIGYPLPPAQPNFADNNRISSWARDGVGRVQAAGIMGGIGNNMFSPGGTYTREQSIVTMMRLYTLVEYGELIFVTPPPPGATPTPIPTPVPEPTPISGATPTPMPPGVTPTPLPGATPTPAPVVTPLPTPTATPTPTPTAANQFPFPQSSIVLPNRRATEAERQAWIDEYWEMGGPAAFEIEVVRLVNIIREENNLAILQIDDSLMMAARYYTQIQANLNIGSGHNIGPYGVEGARHGASFNVALAFGGRLRWNGGNSAAGRHTPQSLVDAWWNSAGHRNFMLSPEHRFIGAGTHAGGQWGAFHYLFMSDRASY